MMNYSMISVFKKYHSMQEETSNMQEETSNNRKYKDIVIVVEVILLGIPRFENHACF